MKNEDKTSAVLIRIYSDLHNRAKSLAALRKVKVSAVYNEALAAMLKPKRRALEGGRK
jgi:hypothetical protein